MGRLAGLLLFVCFTTVCALSTTETRNSFFDFDARSQTIVDFILQKLRTEPDLYTTILDLLQSDYLPDFQTNPHYLEFVEELDAAAAAADNDTSAACGVCRAGATTLKAIVSQTSWDELEEPIIQLCKDLGRNITGDIDVDTLCPGTVKLQGPHVYEIFRPIYQKDSRTYCEYLNVCFPPKPTGHLSGPRGKERTSKPRTDETAPDYDARIRASIKIVQLTDVHIQHKYEGGTETDCGLPVCCVPENGPGDAPDWGYYTCNIPTRTMDYYLQWAAGQNPDFVIYSGDAPPHSIWEETYESQLNCTLTLMESMSKFLSGLTVYPSIGNHEMYPTNLYSVANIPNYTVPLTKSFTDGWIPLANFTDEQIATMETGGYYSMLVRQGLRIISFNSLYWYSFNWYNVLLEDEPEVDAMRQFMEDELRGAQQNGEKVILVGHHPPGNGDAIVTMTRWFEQLVYNYSDVIVMHVSGHTHNDEYHVLSDTDDNPVAVHLVAPCMTSNTNKNPSARIHYLDSETFELLDFEQYHFDIQETFFSGRADPDIKLVYAARTEYGLNDLSPASWKNLTTRMESDPSLLDVYHQNFYTRFYDLEPCDESCAARLLCNTKYYSFDDVSKCQRS